MQEPNENSGHTFLCSWSGGKDSYLAFDRAVRRGAKPKVLLNVLNEYGKKSRSHGIPKQVLEAQAECLNLPIEFISSTWKDYEAKYIEKLTALKRKYHFDCALFGDIDIQAHREWEEKVSKAAGLIPLLPLWQERRVDLVREMLEKGIKALIVSCQAKYATEILGKYLDEELLIVFEEMDIDVCGENGEYHTLVVNGPQHLSPLHTTSVQVVEHEGYAFLNYALDLNPTRT